MSFFHFQKYRIFLIVFYFKKYAHFGLTFFKYPRFGSSFAKNTHFSDCPVFKNTSFKKTSSSYCPILKIRLFCIVLFKIRLFVVVLFQKYSFYGFIKKILELIWIIAINYFHGFVLFICFSLCVCAEWFTLANYQVLVLKINK